MDQSLYFVIARTLHVVSVVLWIGGVAFVTTVLIPSLKKIADPDNRLDLFEQLARQFAFQAPIVVAISFRFAGFYLGAAPIAALRASSIFSSINSLKKDIS